MLATACQECSRTEKDHAPDMEFDEPTLPAQRWGRRAAALCALTMACGGAATLPAPPLTTTPQPASVPASAGPSVDDAVRDAMRGQQTLEPSFFEGDALRPAIVRKAREVGEAIFVEARVPGGTLMDVLFAGSLASYEYTADTDADLHLVIQSTATDPELFSAYLKTLNAQMHHESGIRFLGRPVQITFTTMPDAQGGAYSVVKDAWVTRPVRAPVAFSEAELRAALADFGRQRDAEVDAFRAAPVTYDCQRLVRVRAALKAKRSEGLASPAGVVSLGNVSYRVIRRLGWFDDLEHVYEVCRDGRWSLPGP